MSWCRQPHPRSIESFQAEPHQTLLEEGIPLRRGYRVQRGRRLSSAARQSWPRPCHREPVVLPTLEPTGLPTPAPPADDSPQVSFSPRAMAFTNRGLAACRLGIESHFSANGEDLRNSIAVVADAGDPHARHQAKTVAGGRRGGQQKHRREFGRGNRSRAPTW